MPSSLKEKAVSGMAWTGLEKILTQGIQFIISVVIARALMPSDYGIIGMLGIFLAIANTFIDSGIGSALIQKKDRTDIDYSTAFYFNIVLSLFVYGIFFIISPLIARFYDVPLLKDVTRVVALTLVINGLTIVQDAKLSIDLAFKKRSIISVLSVLVSGVVGILMAYTGFGVWALVFQSIAGGLVRTIVLWGVTKWTPRAVFSRESFHGLFSFGSKLLGSSLINTIYNNLYTLVIGKAFNASQVGLYNRASSIASLPSNISMSMLIGVNYPILAQLQDDDEKLVSAYKKLLRVPMYILYPVVIGMASLAYPFIELLLGVKWLPCVPYIQILAIGSLIWPLTHINLNLLYVKGRTDLVLKLELIKKPIGFIILFASIPFGIFWMCVGKVVYDFIAFSFNCYYTKRILGYGELEQIKELLPILINVLVMTIVVTFVTKLVNPAWLKLVVGIVSGIVSFLMFSILSKDESLKELMDMLKARLNR